MAKAYKIFLLVFLWISLTVGYFTLYVFFLTSLKLNIPLMGSFIDWAIGFVGVILYFSVLIKVALKLFPSKENKIK